MKSENNSDFVFFKLYTRSFRRRPGHVLEEASGMAFSSITVCLCMAFFSFSSPSSGAIAEKRHFLSLNEILTLPASPASAVKLSNGKTVKMIEGPNSVSVSAQKVGSAVLTIGPQVHHLHVLTKGDKNLWFEMQDGITDRLGLKTSIEGSEVLVGGEILRLSDWQWLASLAHKHQASFELRSRVDADLRESAADWINQNLVDQGLKPVRIDWSQLPFVNLPLESKAEEASYQKVLARLGLKADFRKGQIQLEPSVEVEVVIAELNDRLDRVFGVDWSSFGEFQVLPSSSFRTSLVATLQALESQGRGQVLAQPRLLCRSGSEAEFHSGGEFPVPVTEYQSNYKSQNIIWKKHGLLLKFKPLADHQGRMSLKVMAELSLLSDLQAGQVPAVTTNKIESHFDLSQPKTVALSGLIRQDWIKSQRGLPGLRQIPLLGSLFKTQNLLQRRSELVIFVTPRILDDYKETVRMPKGWNHESL